jgi:hypothetical protein
MNTEWFTHALKSEGLPDPVWVERAPGGMQEHSHPFESKALITEGMITLVVNGVTTHYGPGEVFHLMAGQMHSETYGPQGVKYLVSRKEVRPKMANETGN